MIEGGRPSFYLVTVERMVGWGEGWIAEVEGEVVEALLW